MCRKRALAATALIGAALSLTLSAPALAAASDAAPATTSANPNAKASPAAKPAPPQPPRKASAQERADADRTEPLARAAFWAREADVDPTDPVAGVHLASALRALGQNTDAIAAAQKVLVVDPNNADALFETARGFLAEGQGFYAVEPLQHLQALAPRDWRPLSLLGVAYTQVRRDADAQAIWRQALQLSPDNPAVLSNLAMALAAQGDAPQAETLLRRAAAQPGASLQVRQNLTLVLGLQGKLGEAEQRMRRDLPPDQADANMAYLQAVSSGGAAGPGPGLGAAGPNARSWASVKGAGG
jgi:Flp pilus assembly protein TadD